MEPEKGYLHVYTGNGKGKTTAAFGLALRALCAGKRVFVAQFVKSMQYNETAVAEHFDGIEIHQYGRGCFINRPAAPEDRAAAEAGWETCREVLRSDRFDVVILDELSIAFHYELLDVDQVLADIRAQSAHRGGGYGTLCPAGLGGGRRSGDRHAGDKALLHARSPFSQRHRSLAELSTEAADDAWLRRFLFSVCNDFGTPPENNSFCFFLRNGLSLYSSPNTKRAEQTFEHITKLTYL